ncbi:polysaccharide deacetylase family protein [Terrimonas sp. NA20]|uniref:Polysaccharide deacetylase family protein n=1 Tax=Terrimonas ginsenosidimutans TaxID=2908004 RepID=A0ABS9KMD6_9BACT|nr:polysaccharide deacetylase family protein [Terrimonas ginsenosidimutans]MCG2613491.1 polysaccharide deacetylase family protein [Terrimonas ginsenosidimutans]
MIRNIIISSLAMFVLADSSAQSSRTWNGKKAAVVITYDDAIDEHLNNAIPVLDSLGLKATFYITGFSNSMQKRLNDWKNISVNGHELGNHTLYHPCTGGPGREWVKPDYDLRNYSVKRILDETRATNLLLQSMDGKIRRTLAFTCGDTRIGDTSFSALLKNDFVAMRGVRSLMHPIDKVQLDNVDCYGVNGESGDQLTAWAKQALESNSLLVVLFHGVGGGNSLNVSLDAHRQFLTYLKQHEKEIWIAPMIDVAEYIKKYQGK